MLAGYAPIRRTGIEILRARLLRMLPIIQTIVRISANRVRGEAPK